MMYADFRSADGQIRQLTIHEAMGDPKAMLLIVHGMAEHYARYYPLADYLASRGITVAGYDQIGHGPNTPREQLGSLGAEGGWQGLVDDLGSAAETLANRYPGLPLFIMGHSMGSFVAREYLIQSGGRGLSGAVLSGTGKQPGMLIRFGLWLSGLLCGIQGSDKPSPALHSLVFANNNKAFSPARTPYDWLSRDEEQVDRYAADPFCGFPFTAGAYRELFRGLLALNDTERLRSLRTNLPVYLISGQSDPLAEGGKAIKAVADDFRHAGMGSITVKLYPEARHELFNETNKEEVRADLAAWLLHTL